MNTKQKKTIMIGGSAALAIVLAAGASVGIYFAIKKDSNGGVQEITFYSNLEFYKDAGFNQATYEGVEDYGNSSDEEIGIQLSASGYHTYGEGSQYGEDLIRIFEDATYVVTSGSNVAEVMLNSTWGNMDQIDAQNEFKAEVVDDEDKSLILLDDASHFVANEGNDKFVSVDYASQDAGFLAGVSASLYSTYISEQEGNKGKQDNYVMVWGGVEEPTIAFLSGFEQGVNWFNWGYFGVTPGSEASSVEKDFVKITPDAINAVDYTKTIGEQGISSEKSTGKTDLNTWYTGDFNISVGKNDADNAIARTKNASADNTLGANVIFPVAGGQTGLAITNTTQDDIKVIGVDTDAALGYSESSESVLGSATKELNNSGEYSIWYEKEFKPAYDAANQTQDINSLEYAEVAAFAEDPKNGISESAYVNKPGDETENEAYKFATVYADGKDAAVQGWNTTTANDIQEKNGTTFHGNVDNGGVGFVVSNDYLTEALNWIKTTPNSNSNFGDYEFTDVQGFLDYAYNAQDGAISVASVTFAFALLGQLDNDQGKAWDVKYKE